MLGLGTPKINRFCDACCELFSRGFYEEGYGSFPLINRTPEHHFRDAETLHFSSSRYYIELRNLHEGTGYSHVRDGLDKLQKDYRWVVDAISVSIVRNSPTSLSWLGSVNSVNKLTMPVNTPFQDEAIMILRLLNIALKEKNADRLFYLVGGTELDGLRQPVKRFSGLLLDYSTYLFLARACLHPNVTPVAV